ncbi:MAG: GNAT family N-acetyltransferase [Bacteroidales bacterium]|nr:GNAT family N-acetyltransferase [Bacteroidales bacterium]
MEYRIIEQGKEWEALGPRMDDIYYTSAYYALSSLVQEGEARCFHFTHQGEEALYPFFQAPIPGTALCDIQGAYGYNGVSSSSKDANFRNAFHRSFDDYCRKEGVVAEFTRFHPVTHNASFSEGYLRVLNNRMTVAVDLSEGIDKVWQHDYRAVNRNTIRKAQKGGLDVVMAVGADEYLQFGALYRELMRQRGAQDFFLWPDPYFSAVFSLPEDSRFLFLGFAGGRMLGGALFLAHGHLVHYHLAARDMSYTDLPVANAVLDAGIRHAAERGFRWVHLGGGLTNDTKDPLLLFKRGFSQYTLPFKVGTRIHRPVEYADLVSEWKRKNPEKARAVAGYLLKYRVS